MLIRCPNCETLYDIKKSALKTADYTTVCCRCHQVFRTNIKKSRKHSAVPAKNIGLLPVFMDESNVQVNGEEAVCEPDNIEKVEAASEDSKTSAEPGTEANANEEKTSSKPRDIENNKAEPEDSKADFEPGIGVEEHDTEAISEPSSIEKIEPPLEEYRTDSEPRIEVSVDKEETTSEPSINEQIDLTLDESKADPKQAEENGKEATCAPINIELFEALSEERKADSEPVKENSEEDTCEPIDIKKFEPPVEENKPNSVSRIDIPDGLEELQPSTEPVDFSQPTPLSPATPKKPFPLAIFTVVVLYSMLAAAQLAWLNWDRIVVHEKGRLLAQQWCELAGCTVPPRVDTSKFSVLERLLSPDQKNPGALLLQIVFTNRGSFEQPFPSLQLNFLNHRDKLMAQRLFSPQEYLRPVNAVDRLMQPGEVVKLTLSLQDPGHNSSGYQISFF